MQLDDLDLIVYDFEVFAHDWLVVFKDQLGTYTSFWNDPENLYDFMNANEEAVFVGFNSKHYHLNGKAGRLMRPAFLYPKCALSLLLPCRVSLS